MKPITEKIDSISIFKGIDDIFNKSDRISVWGNEGNKIFPLVYITKPKSVSIKNWKVIKEKLKIKLLQ